MRISSHFTLFLEDDQPQIVAIELHLVLSEESQEFVDSWKSIAWTALDESAANLPQLREFSVEFSARAAAQALALASAEELRLAKKMAALHGANKLVVRLYNQRTQERRNIKL